MTYLVHKKSTNKANRAVNAKEYLSLASLIRVWNRVGANQVAGSIGVKVFEDK